MPSFVTNILNKINLNSLSGVAWQVPAIIILVFLLILTLAQVRRHFVDWSFKGAFSGVAIGFFLAIVVEGLMIVYGKTIIIQTLGWKNPPKPVAVALDLGKEKLSKVLGIQDQEGLQKVLDLVQSLNPTDAKKVKSLICTP